LQVLAKSSGLLIPDLLIDGARLSRGDGALGLLARGTDILLTLVSGMVILAMLLLTQAHRLAHQLHLLEPLIRVSDQRWDPSLAVLKIAGLPATRHAYSLRV
jgi:hypothetical protein